ncbi:MAG: HlyD family secretion protein [Spirochaetia bacterium]|nr:HlyD family secretion protein [Spirochaetia bacterium]
MDDIVKGKVLLRPENSISSVKCLVSGEIINKQYENEMYVKKGEVLFSLDTRSLDIQKQGFLVQKEILEEEILMNRILIDIIENDKNTEKEISKNSFSNAKKYLLQKEFYESSINRLNVEIHREEIKPESMKIRIDMENLLMEKKQKEIEYNAWKEQERFNALEENKALRIKKENVESSLMVIERNLKNSIVTAPITGRVKETIKINVGDFIIDGTEILKIIPQDSSKLKAEIYISSKDIPKVKIGNSCKIRFDKLPPSQYGQIETEISLIPSDCNIDGDSIYFVIEAIIDKPYLTMKKDSGKTIKLSSGVSAEARITTDRDIVLNMILRKLEFLNN